MTGTSLGEGLALRPYSASDRDWVASAHIAHYRSVERFDPSFDDVVWKALSDIDRRIEEDRTFGLVLEGSADVRHGSIFLCDTGHSARIRLFYLDRQLHGEGLGRAMLLAALEAARDSGFRQIEVSTFDTHAAACSLYARTGFIEQARTRCISFGRRMAQVDFVHDLVTERAVS